MSDDRPDIKHIGPPPDDPSDELEEIWENIGEGLLEEAFELADELKQRYPQDGDVALARGAVCYEVGLIRETLEEANRAIQLECEEDRLAVWYRAAAYHYLWDFGAARVDLEELTRLDPDFAEAWYLHAQVCEMQNDQVGARRGYERAAQLSPERFFRPIRIDDAAIESAVADAREELDAEFRLALDELAVIIEELPTRDIASGNGEETELLPPDLLGLYVGRSKLESSVFDPIDEPGLIFLFQRNLERVCPTREALVDEIRTTLWHELAHHLGFEEEDMGDLDLD
jgi:predicted Zn-dependent protease with MMP-like domain